MKNKIFDYGDEASFRRQLAGFRKWFDENHNPLMYFQIHSELLDIEKVKPVWNALKEIFPEVPRLGNSTAGNIVDCELGAPISVTAVIFEKPSSKFKLFQYNTAATSILEVTQDIVLKAAENPWVKGIELYHTISGLSMDEFCEGLSDLNPSIQVFRGVVCSDDIQSPESCVFSSAAGFSKTGLLVLFFGGEDFHVETSKVSGWMPIGRPFTVTRSSGKILSELDGEPAYSVYQRFLNIENNENFFYNAIDFPLFYEHNGTTIVRAPGSSNLDGSLTMSASLDVGARVRLSYGEPKNIIDEIHRASSEIRNQNPEVLHIFSCAARKAFWAEYDPSYELHPFRGVGSSTGFFSHGEFLREHGCVNQHNVTLVIAAMREGEGAPPAMQESQKEEYVSRLPLSARMATFIKEISRENEELRSRIRVLSEGN